MHIWKYTLGTSKQNLKAIQLTKELEELKEYNDYLNYQNAIENKLKKDANNTEHKLDTTSVTANLYKRNEF